MHLPRRPQWPVSGGDRKAMRKAIAEADAAYTQFSRKAERARALWAGFACQAWHAQIFQGGPLYPSPTIEDALLAGMTVELQCRRCATVRPIDLQAVRRPKTFPLAAFEDAAIDCSICGKQRWKPRARLIGMCPAAQRN